MIPGLRPGARVLISDGLGMPAQLLADLPDDVRLLLGWVPSPLSADLGRFAEVRALMAGWGLRGPIDAGQVSPVVTRLGAVPALLAGPLRPDVLLLSVVAVPGGYAPSTEVSWVRAALDTGVPAAAVVMPGPVAAVGPPIPAERLHLLGDGPARATMSFTAPDDRQREVADRAVRLVGEGSRLHVGPGAFGQAVLEALAVPVHLDTGLLGSAVVDLDKRGLLLGTPIATYLAGDEDLFAWADGRGVLRRLEETHDPSRLATGAPLIALNTALQLDRDGQANAEGLEPEGGSVGGIGGLPDYAGAAALFVGGLSVIALPSTHRGATTLVECLSRPATVAGHDVDVVVTERGCADLRGLSRSERRRALEALW
jgi:hypothetical protein